MTPFPYVKYAVLALSIAAIRISTPAHFSIWLLYEGHAYYEKMCKLHSRRLLGLGVLTGMSVRTTHHNADASSDCGGSLTSTTTGTRNTDKLFVLPSALPPVHPPDDEAPVR